MKDFGAGFSFLITHFFGHCHVTFPYMAILSFFTLCQVTFPYMEPVSFSIKFVQKVILVCFWYSFVQKTTQQSDGSCNFQSDSQLLYKLLIKHLLDFCKHVLKNYFE